MQELIINFMNQFGYFGVFLLIAVENIFPPIPSEIILAFGGFMTTYTQLKVSFVILFATIGSIAGAYILYYIGRILNKERLKKIISGKIGQVLKLKEENIDKADKWFNDKGNVTVFFCRFIPIVRSLISIPAGMSQMPLLKFTVYTLAGSAIWNTILVTLGSIMGENWNKIIIFMNKYSHFVLGIILILIIVVIISWYYKKHKNVIK